jgi:hypothetical protein
VGRYPLGDPGHELVRVDVAAGDDVGAGDLPGLGVGVSGDGDVGGVVAAGE